MNTSRTSSSTQLAGDFLILCLGLALADLRDSLWDEGFCDAADVVADLSYRCDRYIEEVVQPWR